MIRPRTFVAALAFAPLFTGCKVGPDYEKPETATPAAWDGAPATAVAGDEALRVWWKAFGDPRLDSLVDRALAANLDLASAGARLRQARGGVGVADAALTPSVGASGSYARTHDAGDTDHLGSNSGAYRTGLDAVWELDLFGGKRRGIESAEAGAEAALEEVRAARVSVAGEVALNYAAWLTAKRQEAAARANLAASEELVRLVKVRRDAGAASELDLVNAKADADAARASVPNFETARIRAVNALAVLLAVEPGVMRRELDGASGGLPPEPPAIPAGIPSDLLRRRPDIRAAERRLRQATANIGLAVADYFPKFSLTGSLGVSGGSVGSGAPSPGLAWSVGPSATWNPFQGGAVSSNVEVRKALRDESTLAYRKTVLTALGEVETALVENSRETERRRALADTLAGRRKSVELTTLLYEQGIADLVTLLNERRNLYAAESSLAVSDNAVFTNVVTLSKALGGGWSEADPVSGGES